MTGPIDDHDAAESTRPQNKGGGSTRRIVAITIVGCVLVLGAIGLFQSIQKVRKAAARMKDQSHLKQIALGLHSYNDQHQRFPPQAITDKDGNPVLSWRVAILPYIEQDGLYERFNLDEPWDGPTNKPLLDQMPGMYLIPSKGGYVPQETGHTYYQVFVGEETAFWPSVVPPPPGMAFDPREGLRIADFADGIANTIMVAEAQTAVPWTKPEDIPFTLGVRPLLGDHFEGGFNVALCDGSVRFLRAGISDEMLQNLIIRNDGKAVPDNFKGPGL